MALRASARAAETGRQFPAICSPTVDNGLPPSRIDLYSGDHYTGSGVGRGIVSGTNLIQQMYRAKLRGGSLAMGRIWATASGETSQYRFQSKHYHRLPPLMRKQVKVMAFVGPERVDAALKTGAYTRKLSAGQTLEFFVVFRNTPQYNKKTKRDESVRVNALYSVRGDKTGDGSVADSAGITVRGKRFLFGVDSKKLYLKKLKQVWKRDDRLIRKSLTATIGVRG